MENSEQFKQTGYAIVKNAISDELRDFITQYALFDEMQNFHTEEMTGSFQVPKAHSKYADPAMESLLLNLHSIMEKNTGLELYPTYSYFRVYRPGDELKIHKALQIEDFSLVTELIEKGQSVPYYAAGHAIKADRLAEADDDGCNSCFWESDGWLGECQLYQYLHGQFKF